MDICAEADNVNDIDTDEVMAKIRGLEQSTVSKD
jgi:hypothetical protein